MKTGPCADCCTSGAIVARGLCSRCYRHHRVNGTVDQFDRASPSRDSQRLSIEGVTYRQLDYWVRRGWLRLPPSLGSGVWRQWPEDEICVAKTMARLVNAGITPAVAARIARGEQEIAPGVKVLVAHA